MPLRPGYGNKITFDSMRRSRKFIQWDTSFVCQGPPLLPFDPHRDNYIVEYTLKLGEFILCRFKTISYNVHVLRTNKAKIKVSQCSTVERINEIEITCKIQNIFVDSFVNNK